MNGEQDKFLIIIQSDKTVAINIDYISHVINYDGELIDIYTEPDVQHVQKKK